MKKNVIFILFVIICSISSFSQVKLKIIFNNGSEKVTFHKETHINIIPINFKIKKVKEFTIYTSKDSINYTIVNVKNYVNSKKGLKGIGRKAYSGNRIDLFYVTFSLKHINLNSALKPNNPNHEAFVKRKNEKYAYSMRFIDGIGWDKINDRINTFFKDCPTLINKVKNKTVDRKNTMKIVQYYDEYCRN